MIGFIFLVFILFAFVFFVVSIISTNRIIKSIFKGLALLIICFPFVSFELARRGDQKKAIGKYESGKYYISLNRNHTWNSSDGLFECNEGKWKLALSDDGNVIILKPNNCKDKTEFDIWQNNDSTISLYRSDIQINLHESKLVLKKSN